MRTTTSTRTLEVVSGSALAALRAGGGVFGRVATLAAALTVLAAAPALAQDDAFDFSEDEGWDFSEDEVLDFSDEAPPAEPEAPASAGFDTAPEPLPPPPPPDMSAPVARFLQEGIAYYEGGDWESASIFFWRVVNEQDPSADGLRPRAQFELAKSLVKMQMLQGALLFFDQIIAYGPTHPYFEASAPWVLVVARRLPGDVEMLRRVSAFANVFPDRIEEKYRDEMAYMLGQHFYNVGELDLALRYLAFVTTVSEYYPRALFLSAITHVRKYEAQPAVDDLIALMTYIEQHRGRDAELRALAEIARISMARTFYSTGEYDKALDYYTDIPQRSEHWLDALFEASWAYFQTDQYNRALGNLHSLNSPFFNDQYYPEAAILQAVIFFYNCRFAEVRVALDEFDYVYQPLREQLEELFVELESNRDFHAFLTETEERVGRRFDPRLQQIVNAALSDNSIGNALAFIDALDRELELVEGADPGWANSELGAFLSQEILAAREFGIGDAGQLVRNRLQSILDDLRSKQRESSAILIETDLAEANAISADLRAELYRGAADTAGETVHPEQMFWTFEGEYWRDELGYYFYHIESACR